MVTGRAHRAMSLLGMSMADVDLIRRDGVARPGSVGDCIIVGYDLSGGSRTLRFRVNGLVILTDVD